MVGTGTSAALKLVDATSAQPDAEVSTSHLDPDSLSRYSALSEGFLKMMPLHESPHGSFRSLVQAFTLGKQRARNDQGDISSNPKSMQMVTALAHRYGVVPIFTNDSNNNPYGAKLVFGVRPHSGSNFSNLRDLHELITHLHDTFLPHVDTFLGISEPLTPADAAFVFMPNGTFERFVEMMPKEDERKSFLHIVNKKYAGTVVFREILKIAAEAGASDIHIDPLGADSAVIRIRVDGVLRTLDFALDAEAHDRLINSLVAFFGEPDTNKRKPLDFEIALTRQASEQADGKDAKIKQLKIDFSDDPDKIRFAPESQKAEGEKETLYFPSALLGYSLRVNRIPVRAGFETRPKVTIRLHAPMGETTKLDSLRITPEIETLLKQALQEPQGLILMTGPTGSGKTTTLYSALRELDAEKEHIMTAEDPVEKELPGVTQLQIDPKIGLGFAEALQYLMRSDPDTILIGEIRNKETAEIAIQGCNTGHRILSTLHTNRAAGALTRMRDLGVDATNLNQNVNLILAQRLLRTYKTETNAEGEQQLHPEVFERYDAREELNALFGREAFNQSVMLVRPKSEFLDPDKAETYNPFKGRIPILEAFVPGNEIKSLISKGADDDTIIRAAIEQKENPYEFLEIDGLRRVINGETSLAELVSTVGRKWAGLPETIQIKMIDLINRHIQEEATGKPG